MPQKTIATKQMFKESYNRRCKESDESWPRSSDTSYTYSDGSGSYYLSDSGSYYSSDSGSTSYSSYSFDDANSYSGEDSREDGGGEVAGLSEGNVFFDVTSWNLVNMYRRFRGTCRSHCHGRILSLMVNIYQTTRRHIPENRCQHNHHYTTLKPYRIISLVSKPWNVPYRGMEIYWAWD